jgi:hypothetical protein
MRRGACTENSILIDYVTESPNVGDDRSVLLVPDPVRLAIQVEEPTCGFTLLLHFLFVISR